MSQCELRIARCCAPQKFARLQDALFCAFVAGMARSQIPLVRFRVAGGVARKLTPLLARYSQSDAFVHDGAGDLVLDRHDLCRRAVVGVAPQLNAGRHLHEFRRNPQPSDRLVTVPVKIASTPS